MFGGSEQALGYHEAVAGLRGTVISGVVAIATAIVLIALAVIVFLNPIWVSFEQDRARADAWTGWPPAEVHRITGEILHDLVIGPPAFAQLDPNGGPVFDAREQSHMRDVRTVFGLAAAVAAIALVVLVVVAVLERRRAPARVWRGVRVGARGLAIGVVIAGALALVAFDALFELFHRLFFGSGTYTFDPANERLVQLFPDAFWSDTTIVLGLLLLALAALTSYAAGRRLRPEMAPAPAAPEPRPLGAPR